MKERAQQILNHLAQDRLKRLREAVEQGDAEAGYDKRAEQNRGVSKSVPSIIPR